jgi:hypothetical protein
MTVGMAVATTVDSMAARKIEAMTPAKTILRCGSPVGSAIDSH